MATAWINANTSNRALRPGVVEIYAADMLVQKWTSCPEPISFYADGKLADGQHRLYAIVESGCSISFPIARGLTKKDGLNLNMGLPRNIVDNAKISGVDENVTHALISTARAIAEGRPSQSRRSSSQKLDTVNGYREPAAWAVSNVRHTKYLCNAPVLGAVGRAYMHVHVDPVKLGRLKEFCNVLGTGFSNGTADSSAVALRNYLLAKSSSGTNAEFWVDTFMKAQNAISYFLHGKKLTMIKAVGGETYPLTKPSKKASPAHRP